MLAYETEESCCRCRVQLCDKGLCWVGLDKAMFTRTRGRLVLWKCWCYDVGPGLGQLPDLWV